MTNVLTPPDIDSPELKEIALASGRGRIRADIGDEVIDAVAKLRVLTDEQQLANLSKAASFLLAIDMPPFDADRDHSEADLNKYLDAVVRLQIELQKYVSEIAKETESSGNPSVRHQSQIVINAADKVFQYAEEMRWLFMSLIAELELNSKGVKSFGNVDAALEFLRRLD
jgi:hypothetical protein